MKIEPYYRGKNVGYMP